MPYAQQHYGELLGNSTTETISEVGCFLTSFCNLLQRWGESIDPSTLNTFFKEHGTFIGADDLSWSSISAYDGNIVVRDVGAGSTPSSNDAIVQFKYNSVHTGQPISHFCLVDHMEGNQVFIVDSWDGNIKGPAAYEAIYHLPVAWAAYVRNNPAPPPEPVQKYTVTETYPDGKWVRLNKQPTNKWGMNYDFSYMKDHPVEVHNVDEKLQVYDKVHHQDGYDYYREQGQIDGYNVLDCDDYTPPVPTPPTPPQGAINLPQTEKYAVLTTVKAYPTSNSAANDINARGIVNAGTYFVYNKNNGMVNVTKDAGKPGSWINPAENTLEPAQPVQAPHPPTITPEPTEQPVEPPKAPAVIAPNAWKSTQATYYVDRQPERFVSTNLTTIDIQDIDGKHEPIQLDPNTPVNIVSTFEKDGILYGRPQACFLENNKYFGSWYGVPMRVLKSDKIYNNAVSAIERFSLHSARLADKLMYEYTKGRQFLDGIKNKRRKQ